MTHNNIIGKNTHTKSDYEDITRTFFLRVSAKVHATKKLQPPVKVIANKLDRKAAIYKMKQNKHTEKMSGHRHFSAEYSTHNISPDKNS